MCSLNIKHSGSENEYNVKIADFGFGNVIDPCVPETLACGSPGYFAPEMYSKKGYTTKVDMFSLGSLIYVLYFII